MSGENDISKKSRYDPAVEKVNRATTIGNSPAANIGLDKGVFGQPKYKALNRTKITRSKSLSSPFSGEYYNNNMKLEGVELPFSTLAEASDATKDSPTYTSSGQTPSIFNETLLSTASPSQTSRHPTVIKHKRKFQNDSVYDLDNLLDSGSPGEVNDINTNKPFLMKFEDMKINAVSPLSNEKTEDSEENSPVQETVSHNLAPYRYKYNNVDIANYQEPRKSSSRYTSEVREEGVRNISSRGDEDFAKPLSSSILNPIRNKKSELPTNTNSIFKEPSTCYAESIHEKDSDHFSFRSVKSSEIGRDRETPFVTKQRIIYFCLGLVIILLIAGFTPAVVILANGTKNTVRNYFKSHSESDVNSMLAELNTDYATDSLPVDKGGLNKSRIIGKDSGDIISNKLLEGYNLKANNTLEGISSKYKNDTEVVSLMSDPGFGSTVFYGIGYSPSNAMEPKCGVTKRDILLDVAFLSRSTTRLRNYGMQCNQSDYILAAFEELNLNMSLAMGVWIGESDKINKQQMDSMKQALDKYPRKYFESIFIGNEVLFREEKTSQELVEYIKETKNYLKKIGYGDIPVGTSEIGSLVDVNLLKNCDIIGANVHPFFGGETVDKGSDWTFDFINYQIEPLNKGTSAKIVITEVGWPSGGGTYQGSVSSLANQQKFMDNFVCDAYKNDYAWYYFEAFDEPWKKIFYEDGNKWETQWGIFTSDRKFKEGITLPSC